MALYWTWSEKCGEITVSEHYKGEEPREYTLDLYQGNAWLIMIHEYKQNGTDMYNLCSFFADKEHAKRMLGLAKGYEGNTYDEPYSHWTKVRLNKKKNSHWKDLVTMFAQAFDNLTIEIYSEDESTAKAGGVIDLRDHEED